MTTTSIPVVLPKTDPLADVLDEPRERVHHDPVTFDRLITGEGYVGRLPVARHQGAHVKRITLPGADPLTLLPLNRGDMADQPVIHAMPLPGEPRATRCCDIPLDDLPPGDGLTPLRHKETCGR